MFRFVLDERAENLAAEAIDTGVRKAKGGAHLLLDEIKGETYFLQGSYQAKCLTTLQNNLPRVLNEALEEACADTLANFDTTFAARCFSKDNMNEIELEFSKLRREFQEQQSSQGCFAFLLNLLKFPFQVGWTVPDAKEAVIKGVEDVVFAKKNIHNLKASVTAVLKEMTRRMARRRLADGSQMCPGMAEFLRSDAAKTQTQAESYIPFVNVLRHDPNIDSEENRMYTEMLRMRYPDIVTFADWKDAALFVKESPLTSYIILTSGKGAEELVGELTELGYSKRSRLSGAGSKQLVSEVSELVNRPSLTKASELFEGVKDLVNTPLPNVQEIQIFCENASYHESQPWYQSNLASHGGKITRIHTDIAAVFAGMAQPPPPRPKVQFVTRSDLLSQMLKTMRILGNSQICDEVATIPTLSAVKHLLKARKEIHPSLNEDEETLQRWVTLFEPDHVDATWQDLMTEYTEENPHLYDTLNSLLRSTDRNVGFLKVAKLAEHFLRAMQSAQRQRKELAFAGTSYRAMCISDEQVQEYESKVGDLIFFRAFTSTSTLQAAAADFANGKFSGSGKKLMLELDCSNPKCQFRPLDIAPFSVFRHEQEILVPLMTGFKIISVASEPNNWLRVRLELDTVADCSAAFIYAFI